MALDRSGNSAGVRRAVGFEGVVEFGAEILGESASVGFKLLRRPVGLAFRGRRPLEEAGRLAFGLGGMKILGALEKRIALEFVLDIGGKFDIGQLQKLDRLQELRRHHHRLALTHDEFRGQSHRWLQTHARQDILRSAARLVSCL